VAEAVGRFREMGAEVARVMEWAFVMEVEVVVGGG
jgi:hypothetical protein